MPRKARITVTGAVHHAMARGIEGRPIFRSNADREMLLRLVEKNIRKSGYLLYAWCFMDNHYHLVLRINDYPLGSFMSNINSPYAQHFRKRQKKRGYLFQDRYKSVATQDQKYIEELVRYVHLNPIRGGICKSLQSLRRYSWCGHGVLMGERIWPVQNTHDVLKRFGADIFSARTAYEKFLTDRLDSSDIIETIRRVNIEAEDMHHTGCWVIGNREFVKNALCQQENRKIHLSQAARRNVNIESIAARICEDLHIDASMLNRKGRNSQSSLARKTIAHIACRTYQIPIGEVAGFFGVTSSSVSNMIVKGEDVAKKFPLNC